MKIHQPEIVGDLSQEAPIEDMEVEKITVTESLVIPTDEPAVLVDGAIWLT